MKTGFSPRPRPLPVLALPPAPTPKAGTLQEVFTLQEGAVTLTFPESLSAESYADLKDYFDLFLRKALRRTRGRQLTEALGNFGPDADRLADVDRKDEAAN